MSIAIIRQALELHLSNTEGLGLPIAFENVAFVRPADGSPYCESRLLPADPDDSMLGARTYIERGVYQVTLCYPQGKGPKDSDAKAQAIRNRFARGVTLTRNGIAVHLVGEPRVRAGFPDAGVWRVPVTVAWQAQVLKS